MAEANDDTGAARASSSHAGAHAQASAQASAHAAADALAETLAKAAGEATGRAEGPEAGPPGDTAASGAGAGMGGTNGAGLGAGDGADGGIGGGIDGGGAGSSLAAQIEVLRAERDDMRDRFMRALAEAENVRKRAERDRREAEQYGGSRLARDLLPVFDNLTRALETAGEAQREVSSALIEGVELTLRELISVLGRHGVEAIVPEVGERFDPQLHQAMFEAPVPGTRAGDIIQVMTRGFLLHERLLRPAQVGVSSTSTS